MEKKKYTYDLTFEEVLEEIWFKGGWYQGNKFADGTVLEVTSNKELYVKTFVRTILMFNSNSITTEKESARNNYYNYWI